MVRFNKLKDWLRWLEGLHPTEIDLGLERVRTVADRLGLLDFFCQPHSIDSGERRQKIVTVAGTNGKGSSVACMQSILCAAGYRVGTYTSPHLFHFNERIAINSIAVTDGQLCVAFDVIDIARAEVSLTYFEFATLAALVIFSTSDLDVVILEVGLGGRLDAVNIIDADVALVSNIAIDHQAWLGNDREQIAAEKAGIFRRNQYAVYGEIDMPEAIANRAAELSVNLYRRGRQFDGCLLANGQWQWQGSSLSNKFVELTPLPVPDIILDNAIASLQVLQLLDIPLPRDAVCQGLADVSVPGRYQRTIFHDIEIVLDVGHNPAAVIRLVQRLANEQPEKKTTALLALLDDKDASAIIEALHPVIDAWWLAELPETPRSQSLVVLKSLLEKYNCCCLGESANIAEAMSEVCSKMTAGERLLVCGSFYTVAAATNWLEKSKVVIDG